MRFLLLFLPYFIFAQEYINFGKFENDHSIFTQKDIAKLSEKFLDTKYVTGTLKNSEIDTSKENLIINFDALDCFTYIDTIRALKYSQNKSEFKQNLINTRYQNGEISYFKRNHFFSDWTEYNNIVDITCKLAPCITQTKLLNESEKYLQKIPTKKRAISFFKPNLIDVSKVKSGDYIGIYSNKHDLDVTHTGILIKKQDQLFIRHASSKNKKIIDSDYFEYTKNSLGVIIYRDKM